MSSEAPSKDIQALGEASSLTGNTPIMKFLHIFLFLGTILACLDPDPLTNLNTDLLGSWDPGSDPDPFPPLFLQYGSFKEANKK
jgi:hypothetical protein